MRLMAALALLALPSGKVTPEQTFLAQHRELRLAEGGGAFCPARSDAAVSEACSIVRRDLNGDGREDVAILVVSKREPRQHGVVVLEPVSNGQPKEHWVLGPAVTPLAGLAVFRGLEGTWLIVVGCRREDGGPFRWNGTAYVSDAVW